MLKVMDNKIYHDGQKIGWLDGSHIRSEEGGNKLGYIQSPFIYNEAGHKVAYIKDNELMFENGNSPMPLQQINEEVMGTLPLLTKCAIYVLLEE
jgi:hypothetical protein